MSPQRAHPADTILTDVRARTMARDRPWASALAIADGRLLAVGDTDSVLAHRGPDTEMADLGGRFVLPGFIDVHNHHALAGRAELFELALAPGATWPQVLDAVRWWVRRMPPQDWVVGGSWSSNLVGELSDPTARRSLDEAAGGRPVVLTDDSRHNRFANTAALQRAGIDLRARRGPMVDRGPAGMVRGPDGAPSGLLLESAGIAVDAAMRADRPLSAEQHRAASVRAIEILNSYGVTGFQDAGVSTEIMGALAGLDVAGDLHAWVVSSMLVHDPIFGFAPTGADLLAVGETYRSTHHRPDFVKIFLDGVPPTRTAAFLEPYLPDDAHGAGHLGSTSMSPQELLGWLRTAATAGLSAKVHCTGDASVRATLDAVQSLRAEGFHDCLVQVAHGQFIHPDDLPRFAALGVSADISPFIWVPGVIPQAIASVLPADRAGRVQPNRALLDAGALVAGGSDWPVSESPDPWEGIQGLVTRQDPRRRHPGALWPEQAITLDEACAAFTIDSARACGLAEVTGSLETGKSADLTVWEQNPFEVDPHRIIDTRLHSTWFAGTAVHRSTG